MQLSSTDLRLSGTPVLDYAIGSKLLCIGRVRPVLVLKPGAPCHLNGQKIIASLSRNLSSHSRLIRWAFRELCKLLLPLRPNYRFSNFLSLRKNLPIPPFPAIDQPISLRNASHSLAVRTFHITIPTSCISLLILFTNFPAASLSDESSRIQPDCDPETSHSGHNREVQQKVQINQNWGSLLTGRTDVYLLWEGCWGWRG